MIRPALPAEFDAIARLLVETYRAVPGLPMTDAYERELTDVAGRALHSEVLVAAEGDRVLGTVTFVPSSEVPDAEFADEQGAGIRMLAVHPTAARRGIGRALSDACVDRAKSLARRAVYLHTTRWMTAAVRLYESMGFAPDPSLDWDPVPHIHLFGYRLDLTEHHRVESAHD